MGRPKGSKNKKPRAKAKSAWETYNYWYDTYTKGEKAGWFRPRLSKQEFEEQYKVAKKLGMTNPARTIARSQEYVDRKFEHQYKKLYGKAMPDLSDKDARIKLFNDFVDEMQMQGMSYDEARDEFEEYFY